MNLESSNIKIIKSQDTTNTTNNNNKNTQDTSVKFSDELKDAQTTQNTDINTNTDSKTQLNKNKNSELNNQIYDYQLNNTYDNKTKNENLNQNKNIHKAFDDINSIVKEFNQSEDKITGNIKDDKDFVDNKNMINNDFNINENKDFAPQININMGFSQDGQPFSSFLNNNNEKKENKIKGTTIEDLNEEYAILSSMEENIAIANKNQITDKTKIVINEEGIEKIDTKSGIKIETIVKYDTIIMNEADVEVFVNIVENDEININNLTPKAAEKGIQVSKTLADLIAKSMENNQPVRIDFDNNISVIIKISRDGKLSADFLPSSQVAEAYLKENLPLLRQKFNDNNLEYESLNQRERRDSNKENPRKKDRNNE